jgi:hypothetical protein
MKFEKAFVAVLETSSVAMTAANSTISCKFFSVWLNSAQKVKKNYFWIIGLFFKNEKILHFNRKISIERI